MGWHAQADRLLTAGYHIQSSLVPRQDHRQRTRPITVSQPQCRLGNLVGPLIDVLSFRQVDNDRMICWTPLSCEDLADSRFVLGIGSQTVDGFCRECYEATLSKDLRGGNDLLRRNGRTL